MNPKTIILYHGKCPDGFGGAYSAWKKFGDDAQYVGLSRGEEPPFELCLRANLYFIDFCYPKEIMDRFVENSLRLVMLDHHAGVKDVIESMPEYVYDTERSGATISWNYFHPEVPVPKFLKHIEDDDLFLFKLPDTRALITYLEVQPFDFSFWDTISKQLEDESTSEKMFEKTRIYAEYFELLAEVAVSKAHLVSFEGYEVYFGTAHPIKSLKSLVGNLLAQKKGPFSLTVSAHPDGYGVSIRGDGSVDVSLIAAKYGGNGHPSASGFLIPREGPFPWTLIEDQIA